MLKMLGSSGYRHQLGFVDDIGGEDEAQSRWHKFLTDRFGRYSDDRNHPTKINESALCLPALRTYLDEHHGQRHARRPMAGLPIRQALRPRAVVKGGGICLHPEAFLDQVITWRELGYVFCHRNPHSYHQYSGYPNGRSKHSRTMPTTHATLCIHSNNSTTRKHTMIYGMPRKHSSAKKATFIITCACSGVRRYWNGRPVLSMPSKSWSS